MSLFSHAKGIPLGKGCLWHCLNQNSFRRNPFGAEFENEQNFFTPFVCPEGIPLGNQNLGMNRIFFTPDFDNSLILKILIQTIIV